MKKAIVALSLAALLLTSCAHSVKYEGKTYEPYGIANEETRRDPTIPYELSFGSVFLAIVFCETVIAPVFIVGWDLYQPVPKKLKK